MTSNTATTWPDGAVNFTRMADGTRDEYQYLHGLEREYISHLPERLIDALRRLDEGLEGYKISRYQHSLQTATRAMRDGADIEMVVAALLHDIGDDLAPENHSQVAASIIRPYVRPEVTWIVEQHGLFQTYYYVHHLGGDRNARERLKDHPWYAACVAFCDWDQASFDPDYATRPLEHFEPLLRRILSRPPHDPRYIAAGG